MYKGQLMKWEAAYNKWEKLTYPHEKQIDLEAAVKQNEYALKVFKHKTYKASRVSKIKLARNILVHLNDYRERESKPLYTLYELGSLIEEIFPGLGLRIFNFLWDLRLDLDFTKCRNHFKCLSKALPPFIYFALFSWFKISMYYYLPPLIYINIFVLFPLQVSCIVCIDQVFSS